MTKREARFPAGFSWGTATSAYQIEGGGTNTDWWRFERAPNTRVAEPCGDACDSWNRFEEDLDIVESLGLNSYRFSLEWARIEPEHGSFSQEALDRYRTMLESCERRSILAVVTLHHFTVPIWVADAGGFENPNIATWMGDYAATVAEALGDKIGVACTVNEPNIVALMGYLTGDFPPGVSNWDRFCEVNKAMRACHVAVGDALRSVKGDFPIGLCLSMQEYEAINGAEGLVDSLVAEMEDEYFRCVGDDDFIGVQCYTKIQLGPTGPVAPLGETTAMGYLYWPQCVEYTVGRAARETGLPVIVTENGIGTDDDAQRIRYLTEALRGVVNAQDDGVDVRGYFQWSLLDNFEWTYGYGPKFGIIEVDRKTFARTPKPSAWWYAATVRNYPDSVR
jgi:beta-glucosidase